MIPPPQNTPEGTAPAPIGLPPGIAPSPASAAPAPPARARPPRIALAHDWLCGYRGGEAVLERIARLVVRRYTPGRLYTMFDDGRPLAPMVDALPRTASPLNRVPLGATRLRRWLLPFYSIAVERLGDALARDHAREPIDLLISTSSAAIKGLRPPPGVPHLCYCHSPARYVWSRMEDYGRGLRGLGLRLAANEFRAWDRASAASVTAFIANSTHTAHQVRTCFGRGATVVHPPVRTDFYTPEAGRTREDFWLFVGALEPYKRADLAIEAAHLAGTRLVIAGDGSQRHVLRRLAGRRGGSGGRIEFLGRVSDERLRELYRTASLLLFPQVEDFGIIAAEAQACGLPVVARAAGGALDIVIDGATGALFDDPTPEDVVRAAARAPRGCDELCRSCALRFSEGRFDEAIAAQIEAVLGSCAVGVPGRAASLRQAQESAARAASTSPM